MGSYNNYYMWFSGNNYGYFAGPAVTTSYGDEPVLHNDGAPHEPHFSNLGRMHRAFAESAQTMLCQPPATKRPLKAAFTIGATARALRAAHSMGAGSGRACSIDLTSPGQPAVYAYEYPTCSGSAAVNFLVNRAEDREVHIDYHGQTFKLASSSLVMLAHDNHVLWRSDDTSGPTLPDLGFQRTPIRLDAWQGWREPTSAVTGGDAVVRADHVVEMLSVTNGSSPYLFYEAELPGSITPGSHTLHLPTMNAQAFAVFVDGQLAADVWGADQAGPSILSLEANFTTTKARQHLSILAVSLGVLNWFPPSTVMWKGLREDGGDYGPPLLDGKPMSGKGWEWTMRPRLQGEWLAAPTVTPDASVLWSTAVAKLHQPKTWFRCAFATPSNATAGVVGVHLNLSGFSRGHAWVNGKNIGRFWNISGSCSPPGEWNTFCEDFDDDACNAPTQSLYHVPVDWLRARGSGHTNQLVVFDELGASDLSLASVSVRTLNPTPTLGKV